MYDWANIYNKHEDREEGKKLFDKFTDRSNEKNIDQHADRLRERHKTNKPIDSKKLTDIQPIVRDIETGVVYFDQLSGASFQALQAPESWSKHFLSAVFNLFCSFQTFFNILKKFIFKN